MAKKSTPNVSLPPSLLTPEFAALRTAMLAKEDRAVAEYFDGMTEKERQRHAKFCYEWCKAVEKIAFTNINDDLAVDENGVFSTLPPREPGKRKEHLNLFDVWWRSKSAVVATASWSTLKNLNWGYTLETVVDILHSRRPDWTLDFLEKLTSEIDFNFQERLFTTWNFYRRFVHEKIIEPSKADSMTELVFAALSGSRWTEQKTGKPGASILEGLKNDPALLDHELWNLFEITAFRRNWCFTTHDRFHHWKDAFCRLIADKTLPQDRVLDGCFRAISRPFSDHHVKWFVQLLERLIAELPVGDDVLAGDPRFLHLLEHAQPTPRGLGLALLERLFKRDQVNLQGIAGRLVPALREEAKAKPKKVLAILDKIAGKRPDLRGEVFAALLEGLRHETTEIQEASLKLLLKYDAMQDPATHDAVQKMTPDLAASVRKCLPITAGNVSDRLSSQTGHLRSRLLFLGSSLRVVL